MNLYQTCFDLINQYIYGNTVVAGTYQELVCIIASTAAVLFLFSLPFLLVKKVINMI